MPERSYFEEQRDALLAEISINMEQVLANINTLNRSLESVVSVGKEFESMGDLWSQFYQGIQPEELKMSSTD
ncbi:DASH complex subunit Dad1p [Trichomonascus vanleenenianus]|uniref:Dad1p n=1 Tax=Trichomonascus vanleenenianus TaxID=2268995 RepID=UPI003ECA4049